MKSKRNGDVKKVGLPELEVYEPRDAEEKLICLLGRILAEYVLSGKNAFQQGIKKVETQYRHKELKP